MISLFNPTSNYQHFRGLINVTRKYRYLIFSLARREVTDRYAGQFFGLFWTFGHPLILIAIYVFVFSTVLKLKVGTAASAVPLDYTFFLLTGLIPWIAYSEILSKSCYDITGNTNLVKQVVFPIEILPIRLVIATLFTQSILFVGMFVFMIVSGQPFTPMILLLPVLILLQGIAMLGAAYFLSATSVFFRDIKDIVQVFVTIGMFLTPVIFQIESIPTEFRFIYYFNPLTYMVWCYRDAVAFHAITNPLAWIIFPLFSIFSLLVGYRFFMKFKLLFSSAL